MLLSHHRSARSRDFSRAWHLRKNMPCMWGIIDNRRITIWRNLYRSEHCFFMQRKEVRLIFAWKVYLCNLGLILDKPVLTVDTECKYGGPLARPGSSCAKARLVRPQEFCFDCASERLSRLIWLASSCCVPDHHQFTLFSFPRSFHTLHNSSKSNTGTFHAESKQWQAIFFTKFGFQSASFSVRLNMESVH